MSRIPMTPKGIRPNFFDEGAVDRIVTMMLEMMTELWVVKERLYAIEKVLDDADIVVKEHIESYKFSEDEIAELEETRRKFITNIMRALDTKSIDRASLQSDVDHFTDKMIKDDN